MEDEQEDEPAYEDPDQQAGRRLLLHLVLFTTAAPIDMNWMMLIPDPSIFRVCERSATLGGSERWPRFRLGIGGCWGPELTAACSRLGFIYIYINS